MELTLKAISKRVREKVERDFQWYNSYTGELWKGKGGDMKFRYDHNLKYSIPYLVEAEDWIVRTNYDEILKWVESKRLEVLNKSNGYFVTVEIDENDLDNFAAELYKMKIQFDWEK